MSQFLPIKLSNLTMHMLRPPHRKGKITTTGVNSSVERYWDKRKPSMALWAALDKNNLISKELGDILDSNFGHMDKKLYINESKNQARQSGSCYSQVESLQICSQNTSCTTSCYALRSRAGNVVCKTGFYWIFGILIWKTFFQMHFHWLLNVLFIYSKKKSFKETKQAIYIT